MKNTKLINELNKLKEFDEQNGFNSANSERLKQYIYLFKEKNCSLISLEEALIKFPNSFFNIDLKVQEVVKKSIETVRKMNAFHRVCFASFNYFHQP